MASDSPHDGDHLEQLRNEMDTWIVDQTLDVAAEVYDPKRRNIHELDEDDMLDRFRTLLGFDVNWDQPPAEPPEAPQTPAMKPDESA
jgi:hypothetical protein